MDELMKAADILISKAGGSTCAEALATGLPMIILGAVVGQERANARFLTKAGVAVQADSYKIVPSILRNLLDSPSELQHMKRKARALARPNAAHDVAYMIQSLCQVSVTQ
jgi:processive 1,2-diacylglycerol beta-glucosyltransferase